ncbi:uncharacterized protein [Dysidea avara]|uniref:uncharacterized protein isoform X2 n=1 Tax=Dysidea avara TaxID=196820 RepID=UPI003324D8FA
MQLWDTGGQERYSAINIAYYRGAKGIMMIYDVTNSRSFSYIENWLKSKDIKENAPEDVEKMILGNRCDQEVSRVVSKEQGEELAKKHDAKFMEVSDKANINIEEEKPIPESGLFGGIKGFFGRSGPATSDDRQAPPQTVLSQKLTPADSCSPDTSSKLQTKSAPEYNKQLTAQQLENKLENTDGAYQALSEKFQELSNTYQDLQANYLELNVKYQALDSKCRELENERNEFAAQCQKHADKSTYLENDVIPQLLERLETLEMSMSAVERLWVISRGDVHLSSKILGTGGWGVVQEATYKGQKVAAKTIHEDIVSDHNQDLFLKEIKMMAKCYHKNLVEFIGAVPDKPTIIVIELMHSTLRSALRKGTISPHQI